jgi:hypothetical protein
MTYEPLIKRDEKLTIDWLQKEKPDWILVQKRPPHANISHDTSAILSYLPDLNSYLQGHYVITWTNDQASLFRYHP